MPLENDSDKYKRQKCSPEDRRKLAEEYKIHYDLYLTPDEWPSRHRQVFSRIQDLGRYDFEAWRKDIYDDATRPWRQDTKQRAETIVELAQRCRKEMANETEWRHDLEYHLFHRFNLEMTCQKCTGKLWRAEVEAAANTQDQFARRLSDRQKNRETCTCPQRGPNMPTRSIGKLFASQYDTDIFHEEPLATKLRKKSERPDAVYGLRKIGRMQKLLWTKDKRPDSGGETIENQVTITPFHQESPTTFPFLVCESKSEKAGATQNQIESQMAFVIRKLLLVQEDLHKAVGKDSTWHSGPLVWCLGHRGEEWNVSSAFIKYRRSSMHFHIVELWAGKITSHNGAIQLVLILDHILDWARDVYREAIIAELQNLAVSSTFSYSAVAETPLSVEIHTVKSFYETGKNRNLASVHDGEENDNEFCESVETRHGNESNQRNQDREDNEFAATKLDPTVQLNRIASWHRNNINHVSDLKGPDGPHDTFDPFLRFDSATFGALRDAKFIRSRVMGLYITVDNINLLFNSRPTNIQSTHLLLRIITRLENERPLFVKQEVLTALELAWTGVDRESLEFLNQDDEFQLLLTFSAYLTPDWEQTRELCYIAISSRAKEVLYQLFGDKNRPFQGYLHPSHNPSTCIHDPDTIMKIVYFHLQATIQKNLSACLYRSSQCPEVVAKGSAEQDVEDDIFKHNSKEFTCRMISHSKRKSRDVVWWVYNCNRIGRNEPSSPFLRVSSRVDEQKLNQQHDKYLPSPWTTYGISDLETAVLAESPNPTKEVAFSTRCIFLINRSKLENLLADLRTKKRAFPSSFVTDRLGTDKGWKTLVWNKIHDRSKHDTSDVVQKFLKHIELVIQHEEEEQFADIEHEGDWEDNSSGWSEEES